MWSVLALDAISPIFSRHCGSEELTGIKGSGQVKKQNMILKVVVKSKALTYETCELRGRI